MTTNDRIEAEIAAEIRRIQAWNKNRDSHESGMGGFVLWPSEVVSLANHLVRNRLQVEAAKDAQHKRLVEAAWDALHCIQYCIHHHPSFSLQSGAIRQLDDALEAEDSP